MISNTQNINRYMESGQLHIYKYYLEKYCNMKVKSMGYVFIREDNDKAKES